MEEIEKHYRKKAEKEEAKKQQQKPAAAKREKEVKDQQQGLAAAKEQQQNNDDEQYETVSKIILPHEGKRMKKFRVTGDLNKSNTKITMADITPHIQISANVIYSFKSEIHRGAGVIKGYYKTLTSPGGMFTSLEEIQAYIEECEQKQLDLDNEEVL